MDAAAGPEETEGRPARTGRHRTGGRVPVNILHFISNFFSDSAHWQGYDGIPTRLGEHVGYTLQALALAALIGLPVGLVTGHYGRGGNSLALIAVAGRALPTFGLL